MIDDATTVLRVADVRKSFVTAAGSLQVLDGVDLDVRAGEIVALAGRSGSGKTVLLTVVAGWEQADAGAVELAGRANGPLPWRDLALVPQSLGLLEELTVDENVTLPRRLDRARANGAAGAADLPDLPDLPDLTERLGIAHLADRFPSQISRGEQQRVALARAAALSPRLLLADEPIAHQNEAWGEAVLSVIADLAAQGTACLLATHNDLAFRAADRVVHLVDGRLRPSP